MAACSAATGSAQHLCLDRTLRRLSEGHGFLGRVWQMPAARPSHGASPRCHHANRQALSASQAEAKSTATSGQVRCQPRVAVRRAIHLALGARLTRARGRHAGAGMSCFGFKGGIGSASRLVTLDGTPCHLGVLVLANFGRAGDLRLPDGDRLMLGGATEGERGSVIVVVATDVPLDHRQLLRVIRRAGAGLAWCGSFWANGSGDVFLGFTTTNRLPHEPQADLIAHRILAERRIDLMFEAAAAEATQEAVLDALAAADTMTGRDGHQRLGLRHALSEKMLSRTR